MMKNSHMPLGMPPSAAPMGMSSLPQMTGVLSTLSSADSGRLKVGAGSLKAKKKSVLKKKLKKLKKIS